MTITLNVRTVNVMLNTVVRVILTIPPVTNKCRRCRVTNIPFGRNKQAKKLEGKRRAESYNKNTDNHIKFFSNVSLNSL